MSNPKFITDVTRNIWDMDELKALSVLPDPDNPKWVKVQNFDADSKSWFGTVEFSVPAEFAIQLGQALIACAGELKK